MIYQFVFILSLMAAVSAASVSYALDVTFKPGSEVTSNVILLGDLAVMSENSALAEALASQLVASAPEPGQATSLDTREVIAKLENEHGALFDVHWKGSSAITVKRSSMVIDGTKVQSIINQFIQENTRSFPKSDIRFKPDSLPIPFHLPEGELTWNVIPSSPRIIDSSSYAIIFKVDGRVRKNFSIRGTSEAITPVFVTTHTLKYGDQLSADMLMLERRDISELENYTDSIDKIVGTVAKRTIRKGSVIDIDALEMPPVVRRGELVKIIVNHNGLLVTATGIAKANGKKDEVIRVRNSSSNKLIHARVQAPGLVEVTL